MTLGFWTASAIGLLAIWKDARTAIRVTGQVTGADSYVDKGRMMYITKYSATIDGATVTGSGGSAKSWQPPAVGTSVALYYRANDAKNPLGETGFKRYLWPLAFFVAALPWGIPAISFGFDAATMTKSDREPTQRIHVPSEPPPVRRSMPGSH